MADGCGRAPGAIELVDIAHSAAIILREAGFETWTTAAGVTSFENPTVMGFLHSFPTVRALIDEWSARQLACLTRHAASLRAANEKAWNVYSIFLTTDQDAALARRVDLIEEDFSLARKIARTGITTPNELAGALLPLLPIRRRALISENDFVERLRTRFADLHQHAATAFLGSATPDDVVKVLSDLPP